MAIQLDDICAGLANEICQHFELKFEVWAEDHCAFQVKDRNNTNRPIAGTVYYCEDYKMETICHELLHAKYEIIFGSDTYLQLGQNTESIKRMILDFKFWQMFGNQVQHKIFFSEYVRFGYDPQHFFGIEATFNEKDAKKFIALGLKNKETNEYDPVRLKTYLNVLIHLLFYPKANNYKTTLQKLENLEPTLYQIHLSLYNKIANIPFKEESIDNIHTAQIRYREELLKWFDNNRIRQPKPIEIDTLMNMIRD